MKKRDDSVEGGGEKMEEFNLAPVSWNMSRDNHSNDILTKQKASELCTPNP